MRRREFVTLIGGAAAASILCTQPLSAQQGRPVIGILGRVDPVNLKHVLGDIQADRGDLHIEGSLM